MSGEPAEFSLDLGDGLVLSGRGDRDRVLHVLDVLVDALPAAAPLIASRRRPCRGVAWPRVRVTVDWATRTVTLAAPDQPVDVFLNGLHRPCLPGADPNVVRLGHLEDVRRGFRS